MILPRLIRQRDAPDYLGMDRNRFDHEVRPQLTEVPIGTRGIAFDRYEMDAWADDYIATHGRPGRSKKEGTPGPKESVSPVVSDSLPPRKTRPRGADGVIPKSMPTSTSKNFDEAMRACSEALQST